MPRDYELKDSGHRRTFETGAQRDRPTGKGRYDLISPLATRRLAVIFEKGALKYADRNWEKGMPICQFIDSAKRHLDQYLEGRRDEDHLGQAMWNLHCAVHMEEMIDRSLLPKELNDLPNYMEKPCQNVSTVEKKEVTTVRVKPEALAKRATRATS
jgi:hypothetical protein